MSNTESRSADGSLREKPGQSNQPLSRPPHALDFEIVLKELSVDSSLGLQDDEASRRLIEYGPNELQQKKGVQPVKIFLEQIFNAMTLVLVLALVASFAIQAWIEGGILGGIIVLNIFIGFFQQLHAEKTIDSLRSLGSPSCKVFRAGKTLTIATSELVPGDIVDLNSGDSVPGDIRLVEAVGLEADEALLTGESAPVLKSANAVFDNDTGPGDRLNVVFSSTTITKGRGRGVVSATGMHTEIGSIAAELQTDAKSKRSDQRRKSDGSRSVGDTLVSWCLQFWDEFLEFLGLTVGTPLQKKLSQLFLALLGFAIVCALVVLGANKFESRRGVIIYAVTTAIGTIPVSLLLVLTVTMAAGTKKMLERHVIVRNLSSLEALGGVTNICSDKTGTITQGRMVLRKAWVADLGTYSVDTSTDPYNPNAGQVYFTTTEPKDAHDEEKFGELVGIENKSPNKNMDYFLRACSLANLATIQPPHATDGEAAGWSAKGAPTEVAIEVFARRFGWNRVEIFQGLQAGWKHIAEFPFDSDVKKMSVVYEHIESNGYHVLTKGAVERVVASCSSIMSRDGETRNITAEDDAKIHSNTETMASQGLRVLALAQRKLSPSEARSGPESIASLSQDKIEHDLVFLGLVGIYDPPRAESLPTVKKCQDAGIVVHMLTGDHPQTARAIAAEVGILPSPERLATVAADVASTMVMTAQEFERLSDDHIDRLPQLPLVVARCAPSTKVRMIDALHRRNRYVAMTGDGFNDSPSLKRADIGIAMGSGSDVAKESSDIVLTDDNFASILNAIEEGRRIFDNIQKFILHVLAANVGFIISLLVGLAFKDTSGVSVFVLSPVEILWMLLGTGAFCETGLGFEEAVPDVLQRPPHNMKYGVFTPELLLDMVVYGLIQAICVLGSFCIVIFGFNSGDLGLDCNTVYSKQCEPVFKARATSYTTMTWMFLLFAWELIRFRRSFFSMPEGPKRWCMHLWRNKFLFLSVTIVFFLVFPTLYIPVLDTVVFMHIGITWEWAVVFVAVFVFLVGSEGWKWSKRVYYRRVSPSAVTDPAEVGEAGAAI